MAAPTPLPMMPRPQTGGAGAFVAAQPAEAEFHHLKLVPKLRQPLLLTHLCRGRLVVDESDRYEHELGDSMPSSSSSSSTQAGGRMAAGKPRNASNAKRERAHSIHVGDPALDSATLAQMRAAAVRSTRPQSQPAAGGRVPLSPLGLGGGMVPRTLLRSTASELVPPATATWPGTRTAATAATATVPVAASAGTEDGAAAVAAVTAASAVGGISDSVTVMISPIAAAQTEGQATAVIPDGFGEPLSTETDPIQFGGAATAKAELSRTTELLLRPSDDHADCGAYAAKQHRRVPQDGVNGGTGATAKQHAAARAAAHAALTASVSEASSASRVSYLNLKRASLERSSQCVSGGLTSASGACVIAFKAGMRPIGTNDRVLRRVASEPFAAATQMSNSRPRTSGGSMRSALSAADAAGASTVARLGMGVGGLGSRLETLHRQRSSAIDPVGCPHASSAAIMGARARTLHMRRLMLDQERRRH